MYNRVYVKVKYENADKKLLKLKCYSVDLGFLKYAEESLNDAIRQLSPNLQGQISLPSFFSGLYKPGLPIDVKQNEFKIFGDIATLRQVVQGHLSSLESSKEDWYRASRNLPRSDHEGNNDYLLDQLANAVARYAGDFDMPIMQVEDYLSYLDKIIQDNPNARYYYYIDSGDTLKF